MKKIVTTLSIICMLLFSTMVYATNVEGNIITDIPSLTMEQLKLSMKSKQAKVDIIKKNNIEIEKYKNGQC